MVNKKKKAGSHRSQLKQQASQLINDRSVLALVALPLPHTVHVTVPPNSNPPHKSPAPAVVPTSAPVQVSPTHGEHSPSINHIFEDDYSDAEEIEEEADLGFCREVYVNGSKFFTSSPLAASTSTPLVDSQFIPIECPTNVIPSPAAFPVGVKSPTAALQPCATSLPVTSSLCAESAPVTSSGCATPAHDPAPGCAIPSANPPSNVPSKPRAKESAAPDPNIIKGRDTVFNRLGPQGGTSVAGCSEANQPANCGPHPVPVVDEIVPENGTTLPNNGGWELVRRKKARSKSSQSRNPSGSTHATPRVGQDNSHIVHRARLPSPPPSVASADVAGHRADKGTSVVMPIATGHLASQPLDIPIRSKSAQSRNPSGSTHATPRVGQDNYHIVHRARLPSPPHSIASADVAGHRADKGKSVVMPIATGHLASQPLDIPIRTKSLPHTNDDPGRGEGLPAPFPPLC
ncbi:hypothetical protein POTOM_061825 [Populus tomentosa]|uniref:Uncharacterized protein n=1 Tax=Populus tomentosa TaxID=118781 RepID=A0A8X7XXR8_POPTO|nr:hypothetical protein POTOM_061825 [Populus tomentosa]